MTAAPLSETKVVEGRGCGTCTLCCKLLRIPELNKPQGSWCAHCAPGRGCKTYETRPQSCRDFYCGYMTSPGVGEEWKPSNARMLLMAVEGGIAAVVDRDRPLQWTTSPYYEQLKAWAHQGMTEGWFVIVRVDRHITAILPERDMVLGDMDPGEGIEVGWFPTSAGMQYEARRIPPASAS